MLFKIIQISVLLLFPVISNNLARYLKVENWLSPIVLCYGIGIILANTYVIPLDFEISTTTTKISILVAIPLLLYSTDIFGWFKYAKTTLISFGLVILTGLISATVTAFTFKDLIPKSWMYSGMLVGVFSGGTANMNAVGMALNANERDFIILNAAEIFWGGVYLIFLTSIAGKVIGTFLPPFKNDKNNEEPENFEEKIPAIRRRKKIKDVSIALLLTILIMAVSVKLTQLLTGSIEMISLLILLLTTFSVLASLSPKIRNLKGTFETGEYFLLVFSIAIGMLANFKEIFEHGLLVLGFSGMAMTITIVLHYWIVRYFKIDRDTAIITSTAAIYGPVFIGQVASSIKNKKLIFSGIASGLVGYAIGNYLGISIGYLLKEILY